MNWSALLVDDVPPGVVTVTCTVPTEPAGLTAVSEVLLVYVTEVLALAPKVTDEPEVKPVPVMVTELPPAWAPADGLTPVTVGTGS